ncbi:MAG TPA: FAD-binding oxidoreductase [Bryobacteraceae bacterium]|nr:FAD-binding oxidoreductase [Bryobacteraceae bacterium]
MGVAVLNARLLESREIAPGVKHFVFDVPEVEQLPYLAGQFVSFSRDFDGKKITRAYSTASPAQGNRFEICLNRVPDGHFSPYLFQMQPGETVDMKGPLGFFTWRNPMSDSVLVATGTGIAPFRAMLRGLLGEGPDREVTLVFGVRHEEGLLYYAEFESLERTHPNFHFWPTLSRPDAGWKGRTGHVQPHVFEALKERRDMDVYICGLKAMVDDMRAQLKEFGMERRQIIFEKYD